MEENCDVLIIGGGPSGSIAACKLLKAGFSVTILEKLEFPRFVIGESLLPKCNEVLESIGILDVIKEQGFMLKPGAIFIDEDKIRAQLQVNKKKPVVKSKFQKKLEEMAKQRGVQMPKK